MRRVLSLIAQGVIIAAGSHLGWSFGRWFGWLTGVLISFALIAAVQNEVRRS